MGTTYVNHNLRVNNGKTLYMPAWAEAQKGWGCLELPDLSVADSVQKYPLGTRMVDGDRAYRYALAGNTLSPNLGCKIGDYQYVTYTTIAAATLAYATSIVIDVASSQGKAADGVIAVNELAGGYLLIFDATGPAYTRQIVSNTAVATGEMTVEVTDPIPVALIADTDHAEVITNPYRHVEQDIADTNSVIGVPTLALTVGQFGWIQTWGPCWLSPQSGVGNTGSNRNVVFRHDGSLDECAYDGTYNSAKAQQAGFVIASLVAGTQGAPFVWLQIAP